MADESVEHTESDIWTSPSRFRSGAGLPDSRPRTPKTPTPSGQDCHPEPVDHDAALRKELNGVRGINESIEGVIGTLERAGGNMETVLKTVNNASILLNTWTRILSQTEHNQRLILNPGWKGAAEDIAEQEAEALQRQLAAERRAAEEEERREEVRRRREEEDERRRLATSAPARGTRGSVRGSRVRGRGTVTRTASAGHQSQGSTSGLPSRGASNIGRGFGAARGRSRPAR